MNKIICDTCKKYIDLKIESKHLTGGIVINYFRCNSCKVKALIDVTDGITRDKQRKISYIQKLNGILIKQLGKGYDATIDLEKMANEIKINDLIKEIKEAKAELKIKYGDLL